MKTNVFQKIKTLVLASVLGVVGLGSSNSFADSVNAYGITFSGLSGLAAPSLPAFGTYVAENYTKTGSGTFVFNATIDSNHTSSTFIVPWSPYTYGIANTTYNLTANFSSSGVFTSGSVAIKGKFNGSSTSTTLMTANLIKFGKSSDGHIWGFNTNNIVCSAAINTAAHGCTTSEVVYLYLGDAHSVMNKAWGNGTKGVALTSVPVPAAAWLLGSGLVGLVGVARRKSA